MAARPMRVLLYCHDTFGLGHLRRSRAIAHAIVAANKRARCLIVSGSPVLGDFDYRARVDYISIPGVIKRRSGAYVAADAHVDLEQTLAMRRAIIAETAEAFDPHLFIVDKEPWGLRGELAPTLDALHRRGVPIVLGLRDVLDDPSLLVPEWGRNDNVTALARYYDQIWVYGLPQMYEPLACIDLPRSLRRRIVYTGYLRREVSAFAPPPANLPGTTKEDGRPYILVTPGGGGDGDGLVDWVLNAYEADPAIPANAVIVFGPFLDSTARTGFLHRIEKLERVHALVFDAHIEGLMANCAGIVAMGGYNTFCEILSFDKPALVVPRTTPRLEQWLRARRAEELGLVATLPDPGPPGSGRAPGRVMATALRHLPQQRRPSDVVVPGLLDGLDNINRLARRLIRRPSVQAVAADRGANRAAIR
ncbi:MAG: hypothetical protein RIE31_00150 [Alphaproteobacteria bacterium]